MITNLSTYVKLAEQWAICGDKGGAHLLFLHILPFTVIQYVKYAQIVCSSSLLLFCKLYMCGKICTYQLKYSKSAKGLLQLFSIQCGKCFFFLERHAT